MDGPATYWEPSRRMTVPVRKLTASSPSSIHSLPSRNRIYSRSYARYNSEGDLMSLRKAQLTALFIAGLITTSAMAQSTTTRTISFPLIGLGSTQTVQVSVTNTAATSSSGTAASCTGTVAFFNAAGTAIGSATSFTVASGVVFAATLPFSRAGGT